MDGVSYIKNLPSVWLSATLQEQHKIATAVLDAVYFDLVRQEIISIQPTRPGSCPCSLLLARPGA